MRFPNPLTLFGGRRSPRPADDGAAAARSLPSALRAAPPPPPARSLAPGALGLSFPRQGAALDEAGRIVVAKRQFSAEQRHQMAEHGTAMSDGSFPIANEGDLKNAIQAIGRASDPAAVKAHIRRRAKALVLTKLLPDDWD